MNLKHCNLLHTIQSNPNVRNLETHTYKPSKKDSEENALNQDSYKGDSIAPKNTNTWKKEMQTPIFEPFLKDGTYHY